jgi:UDP-N-acetylglucosamine 2-epimerase (non-hydrolysing)
MREVLEYVLPKIEQSNVLETLGLEPGKYFIVSVHREENVDSRENLCQVVEALEALHERFGYPLVVSTHPRSRDRLEKMGLAGNSEAISFLKPFGFFDYNHLQLHSFCAISDSGTISEESAILGFPAVTLRRSIERPEALDTGAIALTGLDKGVLVEGVRIATAPREVFSDADREIPEEYKVRNTSERVLRLITGTAKLAHRWRNMDEFSRYDWG